MTLPRHCKICRLILNYPEYNPEKESFTGKGYCPDKHYETLVYFKEPLLEIRNEIIIYDEYLILLSHHEGITYIYKDHVMVRAEHISILRDLDFRNKNYVINRLDTLVNFS